MTQARSIRRAGIIATGVGVGAAIASTLAVASADSTGTADIAAYLPDFGAVAAASAVVTPPVLPDDFSNYAVSISGIPIIQLGTAQAQTSFGNIAIAHGDHAAANAYGGGYFNFASADGDNSVASDGINSGWFNSATAEGQYSIAGAGGQLGSGSFNTASASGFAATAYAGYTAGQPGADSYNTATAEGTMAHATAGGDGTSNNVASAIGDYTSDSVHGGYGASAAADNGFTGLLSSFGSGSAESQVAGALPADLPGGGLNDPGSSVFATMNATFASEIYSLNSIFAQDVDAAGIDPDKIIPGAGAFPFDTILASDTNDTFNTLVFGLNPDNVTDGIPGAYDVYNGAFTEFSNAFNIGLFSLLDPTDAYPAADIFGTHAEFLAGGSLSAIGEFVQLGFQDLLGYFDPSSLFALQ